MNNKTKTMNDQIPIKVVIKFHYNRRIRNYEAYCYLPYEEGRLATHIRYYEIFDIGKSKMIGWCEYESLSRMLSRDFTPTSKVLKNHPDAIKKVLAILNNSMKILGLENKKFVECNPDGSIKVTL